MKTFESFFVFAWGEGEELPEGPEERLKPFPAANGGDSVSIAVCTTLVSTLQVNRSVDPEWIYFLAVRSLVEVLEEEGFVLGVNGDWLGNVPSGNLALPLMPANTPAGCV